MSDFLYRVGVDDQLVTYTLISKTGDSVLVADPSGSSHSGKLYAKRASFRETPEAAWAAHAITLSNMAEQNRDYTVKSLRKLAAIRRIRAQYTDKNSDIAEAEQSVNRWINSLVNIRARIREALHKTKNYASSEPC